MCKLYQNTRNPNGNTTEYYGTGKTFILGGEVYEDLEVVTLREPEHIRAYQDEVTFEEDEEE